FLCVRRRGMGDMISGSHRGPGPRPGLDEYTVLLHRQHAAPASQLAAVQCNRLTVNDRGWIPIDNRENTLVQRAYGLIVDARNTLAVDNGERRTRDDASSAGGGVADDDPVPCHALPSLSKH